MAITQKCQYALRALFELAQRDATRPTKVSEIASSQGIPPRFLEVILNELKQGGFTESRRGKEGGYVLRRHPADLAVGEVIRFVQGPLRPVEESAEPGACDVLADLWRRAEAAVCEVYDSTSLQDLVDEAERRRSHYIPDYTI